MIKCIRVDMNRENYFNFINERFSTLAVMVNNDSSLNIDSLNIHSETFYAHLFNLLFNLDLRNLNSEKQNIASIDLIDESSKKIIQVTSTATKQKIENTLAKDILKDYCDYNLSFIFIGTVSINGLTKKEYKNPHNVQFDSSKDLYDVKRILSEIKEFDIDKLEKVYEFVKKELAPKPDITKVESSLGKIIISLADEDFENNENPNIWDFAIEKKVLFNNLSTQKEFFRDYIIYIDILDKKYQEFDRSGKNTRLSILNVLHTIYRDLKNKETDSTIIFEKIISQLKEKILKNNLENITEELLMFCIQIIVTDAFVRCKIFENPEGYKYVASR